MNSAAEPSLPLVDLAFAALDHGVDSVLASGGPLIPFIIIVEQDGQRRLERAVTERLEEGVAILRKQAGSLDNAATAVTFDGYITTDDGRFDAIHVEARSALGESVRLAQRYETKGLVKKRISTVGNPMLIPDET